MRYFSKFIFAFFLFSLTLAFPSFGVGNSVCDGPVAIPSNRSSYLDEVRNPEEPVKRQLKRLLAGYSAPFENNIGPCAYNAQSVFALLRYGIRDPAQNIYTMKKMTIKSKLNSKGVYSDAEGRSYDEIAASMTFWYKVALEINGFKTNRTFYDHIDKVYDDIFKSGRISEDQMEREAMNAGLFYNGWGVSEATDTIRNMAINEPAIISYSVSVKFPKSRGAHALVLVKISHDQAIIINNGEVGDIFDIHNLKNRLLKDYYLPLPYLGKITDVEVIRGGDLLV